jgi:rSAM/selenodomain-associated transferase 1
MSGNALLLFTKPARPGRVKTRLVGELTAAQAAELHAAFRDDLTERLAGRSFHLELAWALRDGEDVPAAAVPGFRQEGEDLGARLWNGLRRAAERFAAVGAVGSDHPELTAETVEDAFRRLGEGADLVLGPAADGGYYLVALRREALWRQLFADVPWSTPTVFEETLARAETLGLRTELLPTGHDVDLPEDLRRLAERLAASGRDGPDCPRTRKLLRAWGRLQGETECES